MRWVAFMGGVAATAVAGYASYLYLRIDRPWYPLPPDDPRCPHGMAYIRAGTGHLLEDKFLAPFDPKTGRFIGPFSERKPRVLDVKIRAFCMDWNEVTVADYEQCVEAGACAMPDSKVMVADYEPCLKAGTCAIPDGKGCDQPHLCNYGKSERGYHPMNCISWNDAQRYCAAHGKRLPLEDEWEYAAQGGDAHNHYPWDPYSEVNRTCNRRWTHRKGTCAVRSYPPESFGLFDMSGNVDEYTAFSCAGKVCAEEPDDMNAPVSGGCWNCDSEDAREDSRGSTARHICGGGAEGFRCAK